MPQEQNWYPLSRLPMFANMVQGMHHDAQAQYSLFLEAADKPHVLDDATVTRAQRVIGTQRDDLTLYNNQFQRWLGEDPSPAQRQQIQQLQGLLDELRTTLDATLDLLERISKGTIDKIMSKSDLELGMEWLLRQQGNKKT